MLHLLDHLAHKLQGDLFTDEKTRRLYATDASLYRELPLAVAYPQTEADFVELIAFANRHKVGLIPRTAGTSLAGQCVGSGIVIDTSHYLNQILEYDAYNHRVRVQPGVIRDELNRYLAPKGRCFGPNTSTSNRAMIGGMVGNNSSGTHSLRYGVTSDHVAEIIGFTADGKKVHLKAMDWVGFEEKCQGDSIESNIYRTLYAELSKPAVQAEIRAQYPKPHIHRRNTGYALDALIEMQPFDPLGKAFNLSRLICGSEGTLMLITEIVLDTSPLPPPVEGLLCVHFDSLAQALESVTLMMQHQPDALELMDKRVLDCTKANAEQAANRFFIQGDPAAILMAELRGETREEVAHKIAALVSDMQNKQLGYAFPLLFAPDSQRAMNLRKAGLGVLANMQGKARAIEFVEDTAVAVADLAAYIAEFDELMREVYAQEPVYYAHAGAGELHIRPRLDLKSEKGLKDFHGIARDSALLVKKYGGSLSGEHGDGRVRGPFVRFMLGEQNYALLCTIKQTFDPNNIFNPGKIIDTPPIDEALKARQIPDVEVPTVMEMQGGLLAAAARCTGSADCRKLHTTGGVMCPSYMATRNEQDTTRARAHILREYLSEAKDLSVLGKKEILEVMDLCVSCKGCKTECPSNVDMAAMKAEFLHQYYQQNGTPLHVKAFAYITSLNYLGQKTARLTNFLFQNPFTSKFIKKILHIAPGRSLPPLARQTLEQWYAKHYVPPQKPKQKVYLFADEFTNFQDAEIGIKTVELLTYLGYEVRMPKHTESGRSFISKGLLTEAQRIANRNLELLYPLISENTPLIGIEPSAILTFRDEFPNLVAQPRKAQAEALSKHVFTIEEFLHGAWKRGHISPDDFHTDNKMLWVHTHCHQKALSGNHFTLDLLRLPANYKVELIKAGCCGMAGSFGYEAEHEAVSMKIGELVLFPAVRSARADSIVVANGFSCRHQIADGTGRKALHPVEVLWAARRG